MQKVHIIPVGFELERVIVGLERHGVSKIYLLRDASESELDKKLEIYVEKLKERYSNLVETNNLSEVYIDTSNLAEIYNVVKGILEKEARDNYVYINISPSTPLLTVGLIMATWTLDTTKIRYLPEIYFVKSSYSFQAEILSYIDKLSQFIKELQNKSLEEIHAFFKELEITLKNLKNKGTMWGGSETLSVPFMPIKLPSEFDMELLARLEAYGGEVNRIEDLVNVFDPKKHLKKRSKEPQIALRSKIAYHLRNLEARHLIEKIPNRKGTKIRITDLGKVFITPRMLKTIKEEE
jgi:hypothetical protein